MHIIDNVIISDDAWNTHFACDLKRCKGNCCKYGDLGSPICEEEEKTISKNLNNLDSFLSSENMLFLKAGVSEHYKGEIHIKEQGKDQPCPLAYLNSDKILLCSLHSYAEKNKIPLLDLKPLWCSLFPLIIKKSDQNWMINIFIPEFCVSTKPAPPVLLSYEGLLADIFGQNWIKKLKKELQ
ncbi:MAG: DUF3109 family protein [Candidatus Rifleibacteriota bacterium]